MTARASLRRRLAIRLAIPLLALFSLSGFVSYRVARHYADDVYDRWLYDSVNSLAQEVRLSGGRVALDLPAAAQQIFEWDGEDKTLFRVYGSRSGHIAGVAEAPLRGPDVENFRNARLFDAPSGGQPMRWAALTLDAQALGEDVTVVVGETMRKRRQLADEILTTVWVSQFVLLVLAGFVTYRIIARQTRNIRDLSVVLRDSSYQRRKSPAESDLPQELLPLVEAIDGMLDKLDSAAVAQRRFVANAAHQLRTPLTALKLQAEQALHGASLPEMREAMAVVQRITERATRLTNQLLLLSRAEPDAQLQEERAPADLHEVAFESAMAWVPRAMARQVDIGFDESSAHVTVEIDAALVGEAIDNLLDNALKYCPPGSKVTVGVRALPRPAVVVEDNGPGIPPAARSLVVERFFRGDKANQEGAGLGLAIVREIALAHGGNLTIDEAAGGGARFVIEFPAA